MYTNEEIARVCHEANRAMQIIQMDPTVPVISVPWDLLDEETRQSAVDGVTNIITGSVSTPEESHESWCKFKTEHGWELGPAKDEVLKQHPCLVPYGELPVEQQDKDHLFFAIVGALG